MKRNKKQTCHFKKANATSFTSLISFPVGVVFCQSKHSASVRQQGAASNPS